MTAKFQAILADADKGKKGGRGSKKASKKDTAKEGPSWSEGERSESDSESEMCIEENHPIHTEDQGPVHNEEDEHVHNEPLVRTKVPPKNREVTPLLNDYVPSLPPSPKTTTSTPINIAYYPPPISSQPQTSIPVLIPIFIESTIPPQASTAPLSSVNVSDTGANTSGCSSHVNPPISPIRTDDPDMIFVDDEDDMGGFTYSPFQISIDSEDEASATKGELKSLHANIDQLILASNPSSSSSYSKVGVEFILERVTREHATNTSTMNKAVSDSADVCKSTTEKFNKLLLTPSSLWKIIRLTTTPTSSLRTRPFRMYVTCLK
ncbi:unnamed protein product [Lactuca saligna]|uniref:Uncharacterized protein n=1 Tax=Lactuca saligna TaxID=75948 RepID=A0AA35YFY8_LACSI|nr:unnamed protein product [Lactuca saligna]